MVQAERAEGGVSEEGLSHGECQQENGHMKHEGSQWDLTCQICGEEGNLLGCDVSLTAIAPLHMASDYGRRRITAQEG